MPSESSVPRRTPRAPRPSQCQLALRGIRREHARKTRSISPDQTPTRQRGGGIIHPPPPHMRLAGGCPALEPGRACSHHFLAGGREAIGGEPVRCGRGMRGGSDGAALVTAGAAERLCASLLPPRCSRAGHPSAASPPSAARRDHPSQVRHGRCGGRCKAWPGGGGAGGVGGRCCVCIPG